MQSRLALLPLLASLAACNSTLQGEPAPALAPDGWLAADGRTTRVATRGRWLLVEFFSPD